MICAYVSMQIEKILSGIKKIFIKNYISFLFIFFILMDIYTNN